MKGLYIVTPDWDDTQRLLEVTEEALRGGAALVQYRHKTAGEELRKEQAECLQALCRSYGRPLIINDYPELCLAVGHFVRQQIDPGFEPFDVVADHLDIDRGQRAVAGIGDGTFELFGQSCSSNLEDCDLTRKNFQRRCFVPGCDQ